MTDILAAHVAQPVPVAGEAEEYIWHIYDGRTYRVPMSFVRRHPDGRRLLLPYANRDITDAYNAAGHSKKAMRTLLRFLDESVSIEELQLMCEKACDGDNQHVWNWCVRAGSLLSVVTVMGAVYARCRQRSA
ncbi:Cytochrome b5-like Heme/Steroid binding domain containing protein [Novymonas esmeraldas]|uniref:Cytochrome b5-like Heme/Steroid binding domain containing protein n=1 Tax=Novymonas esmeraldas TaxID=1808958 RepID=A0AAW0EZM7_9TRYP